MARVTARQAHTRSKTRRQRTKAEQQQAMMEARARFVRQLSSLPPVDTNPPQARASQRRAPADAACKKITEYFSTITSLEFMSRQKRKSSRTSVSFDRDGRECITIYDSDAENDGNNNNNNNINANPGPAESSPRQNSISDDTRSANSSTSDNNSSSSPSLDLDIKPECNLDLARCDSSFMDLRINVRLDEDIEIVEMLPPIPLRDHPVYDIDDI